MTLRHRGVVVKEEDVGAEDVPLARVRELVALFRESQRPGIASKDDLRARLRASFEDLPDQPRDRRDTGSRGRDGTEVLLRPSGGEKMAERTEERALSEPLVMTRDDLRAVVEEAVAPLRADVRALGESVGRMDRRVGSLETDNRTLLVEVRALVASIRRDLPEPENALPQLESTIPEQGAGAETLYERGVLGHPHG